MSGSRIVRREVLRGFAGCAAGIMVAEVAPAAAADRAPFPEQSGLVTEKPKPLPYTEIPGFLSKAQLAPHHTAHYGGALRAFLSDDQRLQSLLQTGPAAAASEHALLVKDRVNRANSVVLHELYFENMTARSAPEMDIRAALEKRFGSLQRWLDDFQATCMAANGWGILARDAVNGQLYNVASDLHEVGVLWFGQPIVVCDVYEHAYYVDYQNRKKDYVEKFIQHIDWAELNRRYRAVG